MSRERVIVEFVSTIDAMMKKGIVRGLSWWNYGERAMRLWVNFCVNEQEHEKFDAEID